MVGGRCGLPYLLWGQFPGGGSCGTRGARESTYMAVKTCITTNERFRQAAERVGRRLVMLVGPHRLSTAEKRAAVLTSE